MTTTYKEIAKSGAKFGKSEGCVRITAFALLRVPNDFMECVGVFYVNILCMTEFVCIFL